MTALEKKSNIEGWEEEGGGEEVKKKKKNANVNTLCSLNEINVK